MGAIFITESAESAGDIVAWGSVIVALAALGFTVYWSRRTERRAYLDEYWFRQVIGPKCVDPVLQLQDTWNVKLANLNQNFSAQAAQQFLLAFKADKEKVVDATWISRIMVSGFYSQCGEKLDAVEDCFAEEVARLVAGNQSVTSARSAMKLRLSDAVIEILTAAASIHGQSLKLPRER